MADWVTELNPVLLYMEFVAPFGGECIKFQKALDVEFSVYIMRTSSAATGFSGDVEGQEVSSCCKKLFEKA